MPLPLVLQQIVSSAMHGSPDLLLPHLQCEKVEAQSHESLISPPVRRADNALSRQVIVAETMAGFDQA